MQTYANYYYIATFKRCYMFILFLHNVHRGGGFGGWKNRRVTFPVWLRQGFPPPWPLVGHFHLTQYLNFSATAGYNHFITDSLGILIRKLIHCWFTEDGKVRRACLRTAGVAAGGTGWKQWVWLQRLFTETLL